MEEYQLIAICDPTRLKILSLLANVPMTNTELYKVLEKTKTVSYRDAAYKSLKKLKDAGLIKRKYIEGRGYEYSVNFKELEVKPKIKVIVQ